jgi:hypothetical protein
LAGPIERGTTPDTHNLIAGNGDEGVTLRSDPNTIRVTLIGTDQSGTADLGNSEDGIRL